MAEVKCSTCGKSLEVVNALSFAAPLHYDEVAEADRSSRATLTADTCTVDGQHFFVRGCLEVPIRGRGDKFIWGVWASLSEMNYHRYLKLFDNPRVGGAGPYFGWLCNRIPGYPDTLLLKSTVYLRPHPNRPIIELEATDHPLAVHQRQGIDPGELAKILHEALHGQHAG
jgi:hypothetical protein